MRRIAVVVTLLLVALAATFVEAQTPAPTPTPAAQQAASTAQTPAPATPAPAPTNVELDEGLQALAEEILKTRQEIKASIKAGTVELNGPAHRKLMDKDVELEAKAKGLEKRVATLETFVRGSLLANGAKNDEVDNFLCSTNPDLEWAQKVMLEPTREAHKAARKASAALDRANKVAVQAADAVAKATEVETRMKYDVEAQFANLWRELNKKADASALELVDKTARDADRKVNGLAVSMTHDIAGEKQEALAMIRELYGNGPGNGKVDPAPKAVDP